jgi:hypothetical protein
VTLHRLPSRSSELPSWDEVWLVEDLARYTRTSEQTIYAAIKTGAWDFALVPGTGRAKRFAGPSLAARFGVPGYAEQSDRRASSDERR